MIVPNSEKAYKDYVIGLCIGEDHDGKFYEAYYRKHGEAEVFTDNNFWSNPKAAYEGVIEQLDQLLTTS